MEDTKYLNYRGLQQVADQVNGRLKTVARMPSPDFRGQIVLYAGESSIGVVPGHVYQVDLPKDNPDTWNTKTWNGSSVDAKYPSGRDVWTDGVSTYYSAGSDEQYVLDRATSTWIAKVWKGSTSFYGNSVWTDGVNVYSSTGSSAQLVLDKITETWSPKTWTGFSSPYRDLIWTDGTNYYYSNGSTQLVLDKVTSTWSTKTWTGLSDFAATGIWTDGTNYYYSNGSDHYVLNKASSTWSPKTWNDIPSDFAATGIWTDGKTTYFSSYLENRHYALDKATSTWLLKTWNGLGAVYPADFWIDENGVYYSNETTQKELDVRYWKDLTPAGTFLVTAQEQLDHSLVLDKTPTELLVAIAKGYTLQLLVGSSMLSCVEVNTPSGGTNYKFTFTSSTRISSTSLTLTQVSCEYSTLDTSTWVSCTLTTATANDISSATEVPYSNASSGLVATDVQAALDELKVDFNNIPRGVIPKGTVAFADLPSLADVETGWMYNVSDNFTTTSDFVVPGVLERAGSNVYCINIGTEESPVKKWDVFAVADVVLSVNPTAAQIAAFPEGTMWLEVESE